MLENADFCVNRPTESFFDFVFWEIDGELEFGGKSGHEGHVEIFWLPAQFSEISVFGEIEEEIFGVIAAGDVDIVILYIWLTRLEGKEKLEFSLNVEKAKSDRKGVSTTVNLEISFKFFPDKNAFGFAEL